MRVHVGTSGYNYPEWRGTFYPQDLPAKEMFAYYSARFRTVEINYTFYRMPTTKLTTGWREQAPEGFLYTLKAPRRITHEQRLKDAGRSLASFCESARVLGPHLGLLLFQLPPTFKCDLSRLEAFVKLLPADLRAAFEFRHESWHSEDVFGLLSAHRAALCIADFGDKTTPLRATATHGYLRLRDEGYTPADLDRWADYVASQAAAWEDAFVYFKHEEEGKGPEFARAFVDRLAPRGLTPAPPR
ncbi:MAG TPA: DUF72 domain-containing protein [Vicinamibacterales bacterium]|nr:DUF72 domain-containing protein [Vicinamibacterales bacterium]